jgi:hypothetical protein
LANVDRFHQAVALSQGTERVVLTPGPLARDTDIAVLRD